MFLIDGRLDTDTGLTGRRDVSKVKAKARAKARRGVSIITRKGLEEY